MNNRQLRSWGWGLGLGLWLAAAAASGQVAIEQGMSFVCDAGTCDADFDTSNGDGIYDVNPITHTVAGAVSGDFPNIERSGDVAVGNRFRLASCTPFQVDISLTNIAYSGTISGFGNVAEGSFEVRAVLRDTTDAVVVDEITVHQQSENGVLGGGTATAINSFVDGLPSSATFQDANIVPGHNYVVAIFLLVSGDGAFGVANMIASYGNLAITNTGADQDGDSLFDLWETQGLDYDCDGIVELDLPALGATETRKDLFVEVDYMDMHLPNPTAMSDVVTAFDIAPVDNPIGANTGINLILQIDDEIPHQNDITTWTDFDDLKDLWFGSVADRNAANAAEILAAKRLVYRYSIFAHTRDGGTSSGRGEGANDFVVTLGGSNWGDDPVSGHDVGTRREQAGTFMHELGHTLGLGHGGIDGDNCKPNHLSIMSYAHQTRWIRNPGFTLGRLDYSREELPPLDETALDESAGINGSGLDLARYTPDDGVTILSANVTGGVDWDASAPFPDPATIPVDINNFGIVGCGMDGDGSDISDPTETLMGSDDWSNLDYDFRDHPSFADGVHVEPDLPELTAEDALKIGNQAPIADAGMDETLECASHDGSLFTLDGANSSDLDSTPGSNDDIVAFDWFENFGQLNETLLGSGVSIDVELLPGTHVITLRVTDSDGLTGTDTVEKTVADTTPPMLSVSVTPKSLWPPNHKMVPVEMDIEVSDICDPNPTVVLSSATSNEPDNAVGNGDGNTVADIQGAVIGGFVTSLQLRAERAGSGSGRVYSLTYTAEDFSGNATETADQVLVPKSK